MGTLIDESLGNHDEQNYIYERNCSKARSLIVLKWTMLGFLLTSSYKCVLRGMMMEMEYENAIETVEDVLKSQRQFFVLDHSYQKKLLQIDPREEVQQLQAKYYEFQNKRVPEWTNEGLKYIP